MEAPVQPSVMSLLFTPFQLRDVRLRNRIVVSPMCEYSSVDGFANDWHLVHLGSRAVGGAALVLTEAIAVSPEGRISPDDLGIWKDDHVEMLARIARFCNERGAAWGTQLAHAGRKGVDPRAVAGNRRGRAGRRRLDSGRRRAPSRSTRLSGAGSARRGRDRADHRGLCARGATRRSRPAVTVIELHAAHGYLVHQFLSPLANKRTDRWGGSFENRTRLALAVARSVRTVWPERLPLFVRISATDWVDGGWDIEQIRRAGASCSSPRASI